jgi:spore coat-associated protein N
MPTHGPSARPLCLAFVTGNGSPHIRLSPLEEVLTRLHALVAHPRRTLGALAVVLAAVGLTVGSGASFTASAANPGNVFTTGTLTIANTPATALLTAGSLKPGDTATGTVDITNTGSLAGDFALKTANTTGDAALLAQMDLVVLDCGAWTVTPPSCASAPSVYTGKISALTNASLGNYAGAIKHRYQFTATLPGTTDNTFQGKSATVDFTWSATQS